MACNIERKRGQAVNVKLENGQDSVLFNKLATSPLISNTEDALVEYEKIAIKAPDNLLEGYPTNLLESTGEPKMFYKSGDYISTSLNQVLNNKQSNVIEIGVVYPNGREVLNTDRRVNIKLPMSHIVTMETSLGIEGAIVNSDNFVTYRQYELPNQESGMGAVLDGVKNSLISDTKRITNEGQSVFVSTGVDITERRSNKQSVMSDVRIKADVMNLESTETDSFSFTVDSRSEFRTDNQTLTQEEFEQKLLQNDAEVLGDSNIFGNLQKLTDNKGLEEQPFRLTSENTSPVLSKELREKLERALLDLGVSRESLEAYKERHRAKYGKEVDIAGFADLANRTIGFLDGDTTTFTEEVSHFLVEAMQGTPEFAAAMLEVISTQEYAEARAQYKTVYEAMYEGVQLEEAYRKEALGKVLQRYLLDQSYTPTATATSQSTSIWQQLIDAIRRLFGGKVNAQTYNNINTLNNQITEYLFSERFGEQVNAFNGTTLTLFNINNISTFHQELYTKVQNAAEAIRAHSKNVEIQTVTDEAMNSSIWSSAIKVAGIAEYEVNALAAELRTAVSKDTAISQSAMMTYSNIKNYIIPAFNEFRTFVSDNKNSFPIDNLSALRQLEESMDAVILNYSRVEGYYTSINTEGRVDEAIDRMAKKENWSAETVDALKQQAKAKRKDQNSIWLAIGSLAHRNNPFMSMVNKLIHGISAKVGYMMSNLKTVLDPAVQKDLHKYMPNLIKRVDGKNSGYVTAPVRIAEAEKAQAEWERKTRLRYIHKTLPTLEDIDANDPDATQQLFRHLMLKVIESDNLSNVQESEDGEVKVTLSQALPTEVKKELQTILDKINEINKLKDTKEAVALSQVMKTPREKTVVFTTNEVQDVTTKGLLSAEASESPLRLTNSQDAEYQYELSKRRLIHNEQQFSDEYYQQEMEKTVANKDIWMSILVSKQINGEIAKIRAKYMENGRVNDAALRENEADRMAVDALEKQLRQARSAYYSTPVGLDATETHLKAYLAEGDNATELKADIRQKLAGKFTPVEIQEFITSLEEKGFFQGKERRHQVVALPLTEQDRNDISQDELITWGFLKRQEDYTREFDSISEEFKGEVQRFLDMATTGELTQEEAYQRAYAFLSSSGAIGMTEEYYNSMGEHESYIKRAAAAIAKVPDNPADTSGNSREQYQAALDAYENKWKRLRYLNSIYKSSSNIGEVDYSGFESIKREVLQLNRSMTQLRRSIPKVDSIAQSTAEKGMNEAYHRELQSKNIAEGSVQEKHFLTQHLVDDEGFYKFKAQMTWYVKGRQVSEKYQKYTIAAVQQLPREANETNEQYLARLAPQAEINFLRDNVASYYMRYSPVGFNSLMDGLRAGQVNPMSLIDHDSTSLPPEQSQALPFVQVTPRYDWRESVYNDRNLNPRYDINGTYNQYKAFTRNAAGELVDYVDDPTEVNEDGTPVRHQLWADHDFFSTYGISKEDYYAGQRVMGSDTTLTATQNTAQYEALQIWTNLMREGLQKYDSARQYSEFMIPRMSRNTIEKVKAFSKDPKSAMKEIFKDLVLYRVDDTDIASDVTGKSVAGLGEKRTIPKYYLRPLEDADTQSEDMFSILAEFMKQSYVYRARTEAEDSILSTLNMLGMQNYVNGQTGVSTNEYRFLKEAIDGLFYGITNNSNIDINIGGKTIYISKFLKNMKNAFSYTNLAFNPLVDITGMTTGKVTRFIMRRAGEYGDDRTWKFAISGSTAMVLDATKEIGSVLQVSEGISMLETIGIQSPTERYEGASFSGAARVANKSSFMGATISNYTATIQVARFVAKDLRWDGEKILSYKQFLNDEANKKPENPTLTAKQWREKVNEKWDTLFDKSVYDIFDLSKGMQVREGQPYEFTEEQIIDIHGRLYSKARHMIEAIDGVIAPENQSFIQRHPLARLMTTHKGWLSIALDRKFKAHQYNMLTNQWEIGHYRAVAKLVSDAYKETGTLNPIKLFAHARATLKNLEQDDPTAIGTSYAKKEVAAALILTALGAVLLGFSEDDDNKDLWALQAGSLLFIRTLSESNSVSALGIGGAAMETFQKPFVSAEWLGNIFKLEDYSFEEVRSGKYKGHSKLYKKLMKLTLGKRFYDLYDIRETQKAYRLYQGSTLPFLSHGGFAERVILDSILDNDND